MAGGQRTWDGGATLIVLSGSYLAAFLTNDGVLMGDYSGTAAYDGRVCGVWTETPSSKGAGHNCAWVSRISARGLRLEWLPHVSRWLSVRLCPVFERELERCAV